MNQVRTFWNKLMTSWRPTILNHQFLHKLGYISGILSLVFSFDALAAQSFYCPQNHGYINIGMTPDQVISACGQPLSKQQSLSPVMQKVPVQQLLFNDAGAPKAFYGVWGLSTGVNPGAQLEVDIVDNKVKTIRINGSTSNAFSVCGGVSIQVGDPAGKVYGACGTPSVTNNTFINQPVLSNQRPEIWIYQPGQYQAPINLTFVNGKLQSID